MSNITEKMLKTPLQSNDPENTDFHQELEQNSVPIIEDPRVLSECIMDNIIKSVFLEIRTNQRLTNLSKDFISLVEDNRSSYSMIDNLQGPYSGLNSIPCHFELDLSEKEPVD